MSRKYHIVVSKMPEEGSRWQIQFGDYDKETAMEEMRDMKDHVGPGCVWEPNTKFKCITLKGDKQTDINAKLDELNKEETK